MLDYRQGSTSSFYGSVIPKRKVSRLWRSSISAKTSASVRIRQSSSKRLRDRSPDQKNIKIEHRN